MNFLFNNHFLNINDCFEFNQKTDILTGDNQIYCNKCEQMVNANFTSYLTTAPEILILLFYRGTNFKNNIRLEFAQILDISNFMSLKVGYNFKYKLIGIIKQLGDNIEYAHFIAYCLTPIDHQWYSYNDSIINKIENFQKEIFDFGMPYILFYQRIK